jgi:hypothetical protein
VIETKELLGWDEGLVVPSGSIRSVGLPYVNNILRSLLPSVAGRDFRLSNQSRSAQPVDCYLLLYLFEFRIARQ